MVDNPKAGDIAKKVVSLPRMMQTGSDKSMYELAANTGYFESYDLVAEALIREQLAKTPDLVEEWLAYSEDRRIVQGWYFRMLPDRRYEVGYQDREPLTNRQMVYEGRLDACAAFVKRELETLRGCEPESLWEN